MSISCARFKIRLCILNSYFDWRDIINAMQETNETNKNQFPLYVKFLTASTQFHSLLQSGMDERSAYFVIQKLYALSNEEIQQCATQFFATLN